jgi:type I restriction enzyme M protein
LRYFLIKFDYLDQKRIKVKQAIANLKESLQADYAAEDRLKALLQKDGLI